MLSMTGYGRGEYKAEGLELTVEIKTVNNRYLDVSVKSPKIFLPCEEVIRAIVREGMTRGHADVFVSYSDKREKEKSFYLDMPLAKAYADAAKALKAAFPDVADDFSLTSIMRQGDVLRQQEESGVDDQLITALKAALSGAMEKLNAMREKEGKKLSDDMLSRLCKVEELVSSIAERAPSVAEDYKKRLGEKIKNSLGGVEYDEARLLTEVAIFTDKANIDEELTRLKSHIAQFKDICREKLVGRKLDFLVQEFNRETNTICSKSNDLAVTKYGLELKNEIEKIREQVQNVE